MPTEYLDEILAYCHQNNQSSYWNPHKACGVIERITLNATLVDVVRKYLGAEPRLWLTQLRWTFSSEGTGEPRNSSARYNFHDFHYDTHDFKSLSIFIYLTDVTLDSGPHVFIQGTHKDRTLKKIRNISISDDVATQLYDDKIQVVLVRKGTIFVVDTSCYHKAAICKNANRLIASFDYVIRNKSQAVPYTT